MQGSVDFAYPWYLTYGHLVIAAVFVPIVVLAWRRKWPKALTAALALVAAWSIAAFLLVYLGVGLNGRMTLPTQAFLPSGTGRVLDLGRLGSLVPHGPGSAAADDARCAG